MFEEPGRFLNNPNTKSANDDTGELILQEDLLYESPFFNDVFIMPAGTRTDAASIPWFIQWLIPKHGKHDLPSYLHDGGYRRTLMIRVNDTNIRIARFMCRIKYDLLYYEALLAAGVTRRRARVITAGVMVAGIGAYLKSWINETGGNKA